jgi:hypothetical protein
VAVPSSIALTSLLQLQTRPLAFGRKYSKTIVGKQGIFGERSKEIHKGEILEEG